MRAGLSELLQVGPMKLRFSRGEKGKPLLINNDLLTKIGFNVSHQVRLFYNLFLSHSLFLSFISRYRVTSLCLQQSSTVKVAHLAPHNNVKFI